MASYADSSTESLGGLKKAKQIDSRQMRYTWSLDIAEIPGIDVARIRRLEGVRCCHNGVALFFRSRRVLTPDRGSHLFLRGGGFAGDNPGFLGVIALTDRLRPEVSVSRDSVVAMPFEAHSAVQLAVAAACDHLPKSMQPAVGTAATIESPCSCAGGFHTPQGHTGGGTGG